ncbi:MAG: hypothetical protein AABY88_09855 [Pseudomonadota bacterium]
MTKTPASIADILRNPLWLADRYNPEFDAVHFRHVDRDQHRIATFLTEEYLGKSVSPVIIKRDEALAAQSVQAPVHFIFHSAFCCSTLLARALDVPGVAMGLKEPVILNDIVAWRQRGGDPRQIGQSLDSVLRLLARPLAPCEAVVIKPSNVCNGLAEAMMALRPDARALLLYAPLPLFLGSVAKKGMWGRLWVRELLVKQLKEGFVDLGFSDEDYLGLTDLQAAAVGWLAQQALFMRMTARFGKARVATLDSEILLSAPTETIGRLSTHFALGLSSDRVAAIVAGPAFTRHSKFDGAFNTQARVAEQENAADVHSEEIQKVSAWAAVIAENNAIAMRLPISLLD